MGNSTGDGRAGGLGAGGVGAGEVEKLSGSVPPCTKSTDIFTILFCSVLFHSCSPLSRIGIPPPLLLIRRTIPTSTFPFCLSYSSFSQSLKNSRGRHRCECNSFRDLQWNRPSHNVNVKERRRRREPPPPPYLTPPAWLFLCVSLHFVL